MKPTAVTVTNRSPHAVYANIVLGQPPVTMPANCTSLGQWIQSITDPNLVFISSIPKKKVTFTPWTPAEAGSEVRATHPGAGFTRLFG
jgi:hypothetical protein